MLLLVVAVFLMVFLFLPFVLVWALLVPMAALMALRALGTLFDLADVDLHIRPAFILV